MQPTVSLPMTTVPHVKRNSRVLDEWASDQRLKTGPSDLQKATGNHWSIVPTVIMARVDVKHSGSKIVPHSDFQTGTATTSSQNKYISVLKRKIKVATWNVRSLYQAGKIHNVEAERKRLKCDILGLSEVR